MIFHLQVIFSFLFKQNYGRFEIIFHMMYKLFFKTITLL